jgi:hypothetical protein
MFVWASTYRHASTHLRRRPLSIVDIASIVTAIGVIFAVIGLFAQTRQRKFGHTEIYAQRYWQIDDEKELAVAEGRSDGVHQDRYLVLLGGRMRNRTAGMDRR